MSNLSAFLSVIAACEGTGDRYNVLYGGGTFDSFDDHPNILVTAGGISSTAAGRYQILKRTWDDFCRAVLPSKPKFDPAGQDWCAQWLIERRGALDDVNAGRLEDAIAKCAKEWASLPGSPYGQPTRTLQFCLDAYTKAGGTLADRTDAPAPIEDQSTEAPVADDTPSPIMPLLQGGAAVLTAINPLIGSLASVLINAFAPLAKEKIAGVINKHTDNPDIGKQVAESLVQGAIDLTGKKDPVQATAAAQNDPAILAQLQQQALDFLDKLAPVLDKLAQYEKAAWDADEASRAAADQRAKDSGQDVAPKLIDRAFLGYIAALGSFAAFIGAQMVMKQPVSETVLGAFILLVGSGAKQWEKIYDWRFGASHQSTAAATLANQAAPKK